MSGEFSAAFMDLVEAVGPYVSESAPYVAGGAAGVGGAAAGGAFGSAASGGASATGTTTQVDSAASATGPTTSAAPGGTAQTPSSGFFTNAIKSSLAGSAMSFGLNAAFGAKRGGVNVPPPPGAVMIDPEGAQAAAQLRQRQAVAGGLNSTITPAGAGPGGTAAFSSATSGGKSLLGQ
jgi:hypothetical protein